MTTLRLGLNAGTLADLPAWSEAPRGLRAQLAALRSHGVEGVQGIPEGKARRAGLIPFGMDSVHRPEDARRIARNARKKGLEAVTLHVGTGLESDREIDLLIAPIVRESREGGVPLYVEIHRATVTQDIFRTVQLVARHPEVRFNGDLSHWYTGLEMAYGDLVAKLRFAHPVLERVRFLHGRVGNNCCMQVPVRSPRSRQLHVRDFRLLWTTLFQAAFAFPHPPEALWFMPELLPPRGNYARIFRSEMGEPREESDRWKEAFVLIDLALLCYQKAKGIHHGR